MKCLFTKNLITPNTLPNQWNTLNGIEFPEKNMSLIEQREFDPKNYNDDFVITNSPFIVSCFRSINILILNDNNEYTYPDSEIYGASFDVLLKQLNGLKSLLPNIVVEDIRMHLKEEDSVALEYIKSIGLSSEQAYLIRKLQPKN
jgi:hypothetical protein